MFSGVFCSLSLFLFLFTPSFTKLGA
ncbi:Protein of unknown function [Pyronema omphalodes CBS 100304]|uniref:Uncharacterized protein n=1 Tax=Pyronema omphalodes (strain CBS 100304) TaxID=1076935 RepID=U4L067_PYROM|nr:Protein of unknown function [Pyronema omphalodes CBS 100304]